MGNIGTLYWEVGDIEAAESYYREAKEINMQLENVHFLASNVGNMAKLHLCLGNYPRAIEYHQEALDLYERLEVDIKRYNYTVGLGDT